MTRLNKLTKKNFLSSLDMSTEEVLEVLEIAENFKNKVLNLEFKNKVLGLIFDKSSTRTRVSFQVAMSRLGANTIDLDPNTSQIGRGEPIKDTARVLSRYCDVLAIRTFSQKELEEYAEWSTIPVINALTDLEHPCQALADFLTIEETFGSFSGLVLTFIGVAIASRKVRGGIGMHLGFGLLISFTYILFMKITQTFSTNGGLDPLIAMWIPNIIFGVLAIYLLKKAPK